MMKVVMNLPIQSCRLRNITHPQPLATPAPVCECLSITFTSTQRLIRSNVAQLVGSVRIYSGYMQLVAYSRPPCHAPSRTPMNTDHADNAISNRPPLFFGPHSCHLRHSSPKLTPFFDAVLLSWRLAARILWSRPARRCTASAWLSHINMYGCCRCHLRPPA